jgi:hypothetical protein
MLIIALVACLSTEPSCGVVRTFDTIEACEAAKTSLPPIPWAPLRCEERRAEADT